MSIKIHVRNATQSKTLSINDMWQPSFKVISAIEDFYCYPLARKKANKQNLGLRGPHLASGPYVVHPALAIERIRNGIVKTYFLRPEKNGALDFKNQ